MFRYILSLTTGILLFSFGFSQEVENHVDYFTNNLGTIETKKSEFSQSFGMQEGKNEECMVFYQKTPMDKGEEERYEFNAADLNENKISFDTRRDLVIISAAVKGKNDLIRKIEDGEVEGYTDEVEIYASSIEDARKLVEEFKALAAACGEKMDKNAGLSADASKQELLDYLVEHVEKVEINDETYDQSFAFDDQKNSLITYSITDVLESENTIYRLNAMDLNFPKVTFDTDKTKVIVKAETKGKRSLIQVEENGELENYTSKMELIATSVENARDLAAVLKSLAKLADKEEKSAMTLRSDMSPSEALSYLSSNIGEVVINEDAYRQSFNSDSESPYLVTYVLEDLGDEEVESLKFNFSDIDPSSIEFDVSRNAVFLKAETKDNKKVIQEFEDNKVSGYGDDISIRVSDIESARLLQARFYQAAKYYKENRSDAFSQKYPSPTLAQAVRFSQENIGKIVIEDESYNQEYRTGEDGDCLAEIEIEDVEKGEIVEYYFNWSDINPSKISFNAKGKELFVTVEAKGRRELIEVREDGEVDDYEKSVQIRCADVESARALAAAWKVLAKDCGEK